MRIKLDENLSRYFKETLTRLGHDADTVADEGLLSQPDTLVGRAAQRGGRMLFSLDVGFADLHSSRHHSVSPQQNGTGHSECVC